MILTEFEAKVFEIIRENGSLSYQKMADRLNVKWNDVRKAAVKLRAKNAIRQVARAKYQTVIDVYEIAEMRKPVAEKKDPVNLDTSGIPENVRNYIIAHAPYIKRSKLAKKTGVSKLLLNQTLLEAGGLKRA